MQITFICGRQHECRQIQDLLATPPGAALLLHGEPGAGRTTLLAYAHRHADGRTVLSAAGLADEAELPYAGLQRLLDPVRDHAVDLPERQRRVLRRALTGDGCGDDDQLVLTMAVLGLLGRAARERPLLCTMDDLDTGDAPTARILAFVARRLRHLPVTLLLTAGDGSRVAGIPSRRLPPLDETASRALLADRCPGPPPPEPVLATLAAVGAGNPQALVDLGDALTPGQWLGREPLPGAPPTDGNLGRAYRAMLDRLPADTRRVLLLTALAADIGSGVLARAARAAGTAVEALAPAEAAGLVRTDPYGDVAFARPLARAMVEATASAADRRAAHLLLAAACGAPGQRLRRVLHRAAAADGPDPALAADLAAVAIDGGYSVGAAAALARAAELTDDPALAAERRVAAARHAWTVGRTGQARALLRAVPPPGAPEEAAGAGGPSTPRDVDPGGRAALLRGEMRLRCGAPSAALPVLLAAADALTGTDLAAARLALLRAGEAVCFSGEQYRYAEVARHPAAARHDADGPEAELLTTMIAGVAATLRGEHTRGGPLLRRAVVLGGRSTVALTPTALTGAAVAGLLVAVDAAAHRLADRAVDLARNRGEVCLLPRALELRAMSEYWLGRHDAAARSCREGLLLARSGDQHASAEVHLGLLAVLAAVRADRDTGLRYVAEIGDSAPAGSRPYALAQWALSVLDLVDGRYADAADRLTALARPGTGRGQVLVQVMATPHLVEAAVGAGRPAQARTALAVFDRWVGSTASSSRRALSARCHALLAPRGSAEAEELFRAALRLHPADVATFERARTELLFGRELRRRRRPRDARAYLHRARQAFVLLAAHAWAEQATAELRAAGESVGVPQRPAERLLTGQQLRIARLVAEGATNREIAGRMFLSTRTVDHHLRNVFHRLGVRSRTELTRALDGTPPQYSTYS
ncbi:LuxR family transcriptional regulator [Verrucosispora sp. NA02020]|uniref:LuxR C-terminal-related transcriptional regulator n=1 Tax=Verrucosispora sp. NA02020 TaxID=2742132 RepID=UPI0020CA660B|nr:LuxR family transcriptional regulator [Verrucosispora sp. NA02020]